MATGERVWRTSGPRSYAAAPGAVFGFQVSSSDVTAVVASRAGAMPVTPVISGGVIYVSSTSQVIALNGRTGARLWTSAKLGGFPSMLAVVDGTVCASPFGLNTASPAVGLDAATGHEMWHGNAPGFPIGGTAGVAFYITLSFGRTDSFTIQARHARSGQAIWKRAFPAADVATSGSALFVLDDHGGVHALSE